MSKALDLKDSGLFSLLQSQWVHRYGLATLPSICKISEDGQLKEVIDFHIFKEDETIASDIDRSEAFSEQKSNAFNDLDNSSISLVEAKGSNDSCLEAVSNSFEEKSDELVDLLPSLADSTIGKDSSPPPPPALNRLRRWLTPIDDDLSKAS